MPKRMDEVVRVARRMPDGRLGVIERTSGTSGKAHLSREDQLAQATAMMHRRLFGDAPTIAALAEEFNLNPETVSRRLQLARQDGIPDEARKIFIQDMLPAAMAVVLETLKGDDAKLRLQAAKMVVEGLEAMKLPEDPAAAGRVEETLEVWRAKITKRTVGAQQPVPAGDAGITVEALPAANPCGDAPTGDGAAPILYVPSSGGERINAETAEDTPGVGEGSNGPRVAIG